MALTTINSGGVKDDSIVNADIKSDAAIAGSKVAPDFGSQNIITTGNVGIGTGSGTSTPLHIVGSDNTTTLLVESTDADANVGPIIELFRNSGSPADNDAIGRIDFKCDDDAGNASTFARIAVTALDVSNGSEDARIDFISATNDTFTPTMSISGGKVGIGTTSPSELLQIGNDSGTPGGLKIAGQSSSVTDEGLTIDWTSSNEARLFSESSGDATMHFYTTSSGTRGERLRITSAGQILIGHDETTDVGGIEAALQVTGTNSDNSSLTLSKFGADDWCSFLTFSKSRNATIGNQTACTSNERLGQIFWTGSDGTDTANGCAHIVARADGNFSSNNCPTKMEFGVNAGTTSAATYLTIKPNGNVEVNDGNLVLANGHGIDFSATSGTGTSELLDDYEEGTWTVGMDYHTGAGWANVGFDTAITNTTGYYVKIGKIVNVRIYTSAFDVNSTAATNYARITGLPFTSRAGTGSYSVMSFTHGTSFTNDATTGYVELSNTTARPTQPGSTTSDTWKDGTVYMMMSGTYEVA